MLDSCDVIAFVATKDPARARGFYENTLGLRFVVDEPPAIVFDANGTMLRIAKVRELTPAPFTVLGWRVPDIVREVTDLAQKGVTCERFEGFDQDDLGVWTSPVGAKVAWLKDPDGNTLSLTQFDSAAPERLP